MIRRSPQMKRWKGFRWIGTAVVAAVCLLAVTPPLADTVTRRNGRTIEGKVLSVDDSWVVVQSSGDRVRVPRDEVASIHFTEEALPPLKVEIRNVRSDDSIDILLEDEFVIRDATEGGSWVDLTPDLKNGNNLMRFRIHNHRGVWGYRVNVRINGKVTTLKCGNPPRLINPCTCCGKTGHEKGVIDDLPPFWIYVDRGLGEAEIIQ
jgi:hypothetical protein